MTILHNNILTKKIDVPAVQKSGLILQNAKDVAYEVVKAGPKVKALAIGMKVKPFKYCSPVTVPTDDGALYKFSEDEIQDVI